MGTLNTNVNYSNHNGHQMHIDAEVKGERLGIGSKATFGENSSITQVRASHDAGQCGQTTVSHDLNTGATKFNHQVPLPKGNINSGIMVDKDLQIQAVAVSTSFKF